MCASVICDADRPGSNASAFPLRPDRMTSWSLVPAAYRGAVHRLVCGMHWAIIAEQSCLSAPPARTRPGATSPGAVSKLCGSQTNTWCSSTVHPAPDGRVRAQCCIRVLSTSAVNVSADSSEAHSTTSHPDAVAGLTDMQQSQVDGFVTFLLQQNEKMNLTGRVKLSVAPAPWFMLDHGIAPPHPGYGRDYVLGITTPSGLVEHEQTFKHATCISVSNAVAAPCSPGYRHSGLRLTQGYAWGAMSHKTSHFWAATDTGLPPCHSREGPRGGVRATRARLSGAAAGAGRPHGGGACSAGRRTGWRQRFSTPRCCAKRQ